MITWEPWSAPEGETHVAEQPEISLARIADGHFDKLIRAWARDVAAYRGPVYIRLMHEMNGTWYPWGVHVNGNTPADFVRAWRHVHRIFDRAGARNVSWIWSINNLERIAGENHDIDAYYPGRKYVDWVSTSGFNWGNAYEWSSWRTADPLYRATYDQLVAVRQAGDDQRDRHHGRRRRRPRLDPSDVPDASAPRTRGCTRCSGTTTSTAAASTSASRVRPPARSRSRARSGKGWLQKPRFRVVARRP